MIRAIDTFKRLVFSRRSFRSYVIICFTAIIVFLISHTAYSKGENIQYVYDTIQASTSQRNSDILKESLSQIKIKPIDEVPVTPMELIPTYDDMIDLKKDTFWNPLTKQYYKKFEELDLESRCAFYFRHLYTMNEKWSNSLSTVSFLINDVDEKALDKMKDKHGIMLADEETIKLHKRKNDIGLAFQRLRLYDTCFLQNEDVNMERIFKRDDGHESNNNDEAEDIEKVLKKADNEYTKREIQEPPELEYDQYDFEHRMFPFLNHFNKDNFTTLIPKITMVDGKTLEKGYLPILNPDDGTMTGSSTFEYDPTISFWSNWNKMSGIVGKRGIILSFADGHLDYATKLITTFKYQGNKLPIQIIYKTGDLNSQTIKILQRVATDMDIDYAKIDTEDERTPVPQQLIFVDITDTLNKDVIGNYKKYKNKWLAVTFNLFEEFIFMDIDAISYVDMNYYFETEEYKKTGTIFFRDRILLFNTVDRCVPIFDTLQPKIKEAKYFGNFPFIDRDYVTDECEKNLSVEEVIFKRYFDDHYQHQMEAGLLAVDKTRHVIPMVIASMLHMSKKTEICNYGDKDFFWIGFVVAGHPYSFHSVNAGTVGKYERKKKTSTTEEGSICAIQIAHMSHDDHLLWLNGGANNCKVDSAKKDWAHEKMGPFLKKKFKTFERLKKWYSVDPIDTEYGMVSADRYDAWGGYIGNCKGYVWCLHYSKKLKDFSFDETVERGRLINFSKDEQAQLLATNTVWTTFNLTDYKINMKKESNEKSKLKSN
ncbi:hypothetical protein Kpol_1057p22 [Vanderwaltozyma polyspora DSM 70294]|uniref:Uncharacterized protein n=1 Tax=Vanderwaltozyma polyspora (strain ATCC 22028 / DSM 70294 / BCRC 21397 / CBS 2163 / NBRC 10782 / NRRL Y-8283 / UCD 57-17) TaxID=436907 RepID=A7TPJ0_VANPO|nr:uncharacterized protein Kpol_1057p22 [Vanderwaltozyma polyspora DSM 70294]EDO15834.1 hypothetical protein Kpol_1057p22 [Vanderwaltozyma polyspora DSM 70294]